MSHLTHARQFGFAALAVALAAAPASAQSVEEFYKGKTLSILMGTGPGASYDLYGRTIAEHLQRHIPGNPTIIVEHMPGAGGVIAANHIYNTAPQDGTKMLLSHAIPLSEKLEPAGVRFQYHRWMPSGAKRCRAAYSSMSVFVAVRKMWASSCDAPLL